MDTATTRAQFEFRSASIQSAMRGAISPVSPVGIVTLRRQRKIRHHTAATSLGVHVELDVVRELDAYASRRSFQTTVRSRLTHERDGDSAADRLRDHRPRGRGDLDMSAGGLRGDT